MTAFESQYSQRKKRKRISQEEVEASREILAVNQPNSTQEGIRMISESQDQRCESSERTSVKCKTGIKQKQSKLREFGFVNQKCEPTSLEAENRKKSQII